MLGNHEFYGGDDIGILDKPLYEKLRYNVALVNNTSSIHNDTKIIFSALWSRISKQNRNSIVNGMNDFRLIPYHKKRFTVDDFNKMHEKSVQFISEELKKNPLEQKTVVATHHVPSMACNSPDFEGSPLNDAFIADLDELIMKNDIDYWIYGHIHRNLPEIKVGNTKLVSNQLGYIHAHENKGYKNDACIHI